METGIQEADLKVKTELYCRMALQSEVGGRRERQGVRDISHITHVVFFSHKEGLNKMSDWKKVRKCWSQQILLGVRDNGEATPYSVGHALASCYL